MGGRQWVSGGELGLQSGEEPSPGDLKAAICEILDPSETVPRALKRLRPARPTKVGGKRKMGCAAGNRKMAKRDTKDFLDGLGEDKTDGAGERDEAAVRAAFDRLTDAAADLMNMGFEDIYIQTREQISKSASQGYTSTIGNSKYIWHDDGTGAAGPTQSDRGGHKGHYIGDSWQYDKREGLNGDSFDPVTSKDCATDAGTKAAVSAEEGKEKPEDGKTGSTPPYSVVASNPVDASQHGSVTPSTAVETAVEEPVEDIKRKAPDSTAESRASAMLAGNNSGGAQTLVPHGMPPDYPQYPYPTAFEQGWAHQHQQSGSGYDQYYRQFQQYYGFQSPDPGSYFTHQYYYASQGHYDPRYSQPLPQPPPFAPPPHGRPYPGAHGAY